MLPLLSMDKVYEEAKFPKENGAVRYFSPWIGARAPVERFLFLSALRCGRADWICRSVFIPLREARSLFNYFKYETIGFSKFKLVLVGAFHNMIMDEIPRRFPKLKVAFLEVSAQWLPYVLTDLAKRYYLQGRELNKKNCCARAASMSAVKPAMISPILSSMPAKTTWSWVPITDTPIAPRNYWRFAACWRTSD